MIHKNIKYGNIENVTVVEFGNGTISIVNGANTDHLTLLMKTKDKTEVGSISGEYKSSDEFEPEVAIVFKTKESFDVFTEFVDNIKKEFNF